MTSLEENDNALKEKKKKVEEIDDFEMRGFVGFFSYYKILLV